MDRRLLSLVLLLAGCGGHSSISPVQTERLPVSAPALGADGFDLAVSGDGAATSRKGTGATEGIVTIAAPAKDGTAVEVTAGLPATRSHYGPQLVQTLTLRLNGPGGLVAGNAFAFDGTVNRAEYDDEYVYTGANYGDGGGDSALATRGTVAVTSVSGGRVTLTLANASFAPQGLSTPVPPIVVSGTITGTFSAS